MRSGCAVGNWTKDVRTVNVPMGDQPKRVTLVYPYYENPKFFAYQMRHWLTLSEHPDMLGRLSVIVVDDGSPASPAAEVVDELKFARDSFYQPRLFRIGVDVRWNWLAARNIGAHHAPDGWLLMTDMDHVVPVATLRALVYGQHNPSEVYFFQRKEHTGEVVNPHSASFFLHRDLFWTIGGYDEALSGHYGTDGVWRAEIAKHAPMRLLPEYLVRHEYQGDSSTTRYLRKQPEDAAVRKLVQARGKGWKPKTLSFPYHEVAA